MNIREGLWDIYERNGELHPELVVEESTPEDAPLHDRFEWDDGLAAQAYRLGQASDMIRSVKIRFSHDQRGNARKVNQWLSIEPEDGTRRTYRPVEELVMEDIPYEIKLREFKREWKRFEARYGDLKEFGQIVRGQEEAA
jgi:hypothetical protein